MPVESPKSTLSSIITPPRLRSPSKTKAAKDAGSLQFAQEDKLFVTQLNEGSQGDDQGTPTQLEDIELQEKESSVSRIEFLEKSVIGRRANRSGLLI